MVTGRKQALTTGTLEHKRLTLNYRCISCRSDLEDGLMAVSGYLWRKILSNRVTVGNTATTNNRLWIHWLSED